MKNEKDEGTSNWIRLDNGRQGLFRFRFIGLGLGL